MTIIIDESTPNNVYDRLVQEALGRFMVELLGETSEELRDRSPVGASPGSEALANNWDVFEDKSVFGSADLSFKYRIENRVNDALQRVVGSSPGTQVDPRSGTPLSRWAQLKLGSAGAAYPVARKIFDEGTERYRTGENILGASRDGAIPPDNTVSRFAEAKLARDWSRVVIG